mmetsp:Transcript_4074/g.10464  ORF Transcript_4074/g.10464 Transcript_4074/m.10464 type:complete len:170 (-) Transcript_4074:36-545(-)
MLDVWNGLRHGHRSHRDGRFALIPQHLVRGLAEGAIDDGRLRYSRYAIVFVALQGLDLSSHWFHMYSTATAGGHHKSEAALAKRNVVLRVYYASYPLFAYLCVSAELTYIALYILHFKPDAAFAGIPLKVALKCTFAPGCVIKQIVNVAQLVSAANDLASRDLAAEKHQ